MHFDTNQNNLYVSGFQPGGCDPRGGCLPIFYGSWKLLIKYSLWFSIVQVQLHFVCLT